MNPGTTLSDFYQRWVAWLDRIDARYVQLIVVGLLSWPTIFSSAPSTGIDPAWSHSLQQAITGGKVFGRDFVFTYGPLGYLLIRAPVNKLVLLLFDIFVLTSLLSIYRRLMPASLRPIWFVGLLILALNTRRAFIIPEGVLFVLLGYWLWRLYIDDSFAIPLTGTLAAAMILFFGKANYGLIVMGLIPAYALGLLVCGRSWKKAAGLLVSFTALLALGLALGHVDLIPNLKSSLAFASGYSEAMADPRGRLLAFSGAFLAAIIVAAILAQFRFAIWRNWLMVCPFLILAVWLFFENGWVRADNGHVALFFANLPLLLAIWVLAFPAARSPRILLAFFAVIGLCQNDLLKSSPNWFSCTPLKYARGFFGSPWRQSVPELASQIRSAAPQMIVPDRIHLLIGDAPVDAMPLDSDLPLINGLNTRSRPILQSYAAFSPWLDGQNADFLRAPGAPAFIIYVARNANSIDDRIAAWDESITKRVLLENYAPIAQFQMSNLWAVGDNPNGPASAVVLRGSPGARAFEPVSTNLVTIDLDKPFTVPPSTNYEFLWLDVPRSPLGKVAVMAGQFPKLTVSVNYSDGSTQEHRAILPILETGVLINYRVESSEETERWLYGKMDENSSVRSICFQSKSRWAFKPPFHGRIVTCRLVSKSDIR